MQALGVLYSETGGQYFTSPKKRSWCFETMRTLVLTAG